MGFLDRAAGQAQTALIEGLASPIPFVGDAVGDAVERAADQRRRQQQAQQKRTLNSTSTAWNNKALLLTRTATRLAIFDVKQGLLRNSLGALLWASNLAATTEIDVPGKPGLFFEFIIKSAGQPTLTFRARRKFLTKVQQLQAIVRAAHPIP